MNALDEARELGQESIGTEHLLLALARDERGLGARVLEDAGVTAAALRALLPRGTKMWPKSGGAQMPFERAAKEALERSAAVADGLGHAWVGTEHVLLALCDSTEGVAARALTALGAPPEHVRQRILATLSGE